ncbi:MAG: dTMP kinase [Candidatus Aenigmatarchaeota archaeon]
MFIVLEGIDGAGKSTQCKLLYDYLTKKNEKVFLTKEPTYGIIGKFLRKVLEKKYELSNLSIQLLMMADRSEHVKEIKEKLKSGYWVLCDRYFFSTIAYGSVEDDKYYKELLEINLKLFPLPDYLIFIKIKPEVSIERIKGKKRKLFEELEFLKKVEEKYEKILKERKIIKKVKMIIVNGEKNKEEVFEDIKSKISKW